MSDKKVKCLYRYEMEHREGVASLFLVELPIVGTTPCGIYVEVSYKRKKWVGNTTKNRYAYNDEKYALKAYIKRKTYRNHCITEEMKRNDVTLSSAKELLKKYDKQGKNSTTKRCPKLPRSGVFRKTSFSTSDW
jgi:hypothetical protein